MKTWHWHSIRRAGILALTGALTAPLAAVAQQPRVTTQQVSSQTAQQAVQTQAQQSQAANAGTRFLEACQLAASRGQILPGCNQITQSHGQQLHGNELDQLKQEALRTRNPQLMTMVGDAYHNQRVGTGDISQAYRWYVLGAVRGDPQAMARLSDMYRRGQGAAPDRVKALGYATLAQRMAPDSAAGRQAAQAAQALRKSMAGRELAQAERFAEELVQQMAQGQGMSGALAPWAATPRMPTQAGAVGLDANRLPGAAAAAAAIAVPDAADGVAGAANNRVASGRTGGQKAPTVAPGRAAATPAHQAAARAPGAAQALPPPAPVILRPTAPAKQPASAAGAVSPAP